MGKNWAIVVGINNYDNLQPLKYAKRDAEVMAAWFGEEAQFDRVFLFTEDSLPIPSSSPIPTQPSYGRFHRFLNAQFETPLLQPEDNLWFFFAGHGKRYLDQDYLMFLDSDPLASITAISVDYVTQRLRRCGAGNIVVLLDACRDEGSRGGLGIGTEEHQGVITFYSCAAHQQSWEIDELQHGSFTYVLLEGLRLQGEANCATVERLDQYLRYQVPQLNARYQKAIQNPYLKAEPPYKMYFILLEQVARIKDIEPLKYQASLAENRGDLLLAKQLWLRVLTASRGDLDAVDAIGRIAVRQGGNFEASSSRRESVTSSPSGDRSATSHPTLSSSVSSETTQKSEFKIATPPVRVWRCEYTLTDHLDTVNCVAISPDGQTLVSGSADKTIKIWNLKTGRQLLTLEGHSDTVNSVVISADGQTLVSGGADKTIKIWHLNTGKLIRNLGGWFSPHLDSICSLAITPDGQTLISGSRDHTIKLWNLATGKQTGNLSQNSWGVYSLAMTPDGQAIASDCVDHSIKLCNRDTEELLQNFLDHANWIWAIAISPNGKILASGSEDCTVKLWNLETGKLLHTLTDHSNAVHSVSFSWDGQILASGSYDNTIKLWNVENWQLIQTLMGHENGVNAIAFSADGRIIASASDDKTIKIWQA
jgi:WD40 repeat protein/uncharacterized caspase-like protein